MTYTDDNVGAIVASAKAAGLYEDAVVVLWGDHGYQLGENDQWSKVSNFEQSVRIPLMIRTPGTVKYRMAGKRTTALWEAVDLLPTITDLAMGQVPPSCPNSLNGSRRIESCTDGKSAAALFNPTTDPSSWKAAAISQVPRGKLVNGEPGDVAGEHFMGYTVRVADWRYTEWVRFENTSGVADWLTIVGRELYPEALGRTCKFDSDSVNVAADPANAAVVTRLAAMLRAIV